MHNDIYNNYFENLGVGVLAQEQNRNADGSEGLEIKCNDYYLCEYDIAVTQEEQHAAVLGIKYYQGSPDNDPEAPANNTFSYTWQNPKSAKSAKVIDALDERFEPMPGYMMAEIMGGLNITGGKEFLERKLAKHSSTRARSLSKLLRHYKNDTINAWANDSLMALLQNEQNPGARYLLAFMYLDMEDSLSVVNILNNIPVEFTLNDNQQALHELYDDLFDVLLDIQIDSLGLDSIQIQTLQDIAANHNKLPGVYARNILVANDLMNYQEPVYLPDNLKSTPTWEYDKPTEQVEGSLLKVFPNPAGTYFIIEYDIREFEGNALIIISDITGKHVLSFYLEDKQNQRIIVTRAYPAGIYIIQLFINGVLKESSKINILK